MSPRWVYLALLAYVSGFALFPPRVFLVVDEERYVTQAVAFSQGARTLPGAELLTGLPSQVVTDAPPGTPLLQAPFVLLGGWRAAALLSVLALIVTTLVTMRWLRENDRDPAFALLIPGFLGTLFFGRIGMSDVPAAAMVALATWLLFRANERDWRSSLAAGFVAGTCMLFREPPLLLLAPLAAGAILRKRCVPWALVIGGVIGIGLRLAAYGALLGSPLHMRDPGYGFSLQSVTSGLPLYAGILLIMLPGGLLLPFLYRGPRRAEMVIAVGSYVALFSVFEYNPIRDNGLLKGVVLASRYMIPAIPLLAFMAADVVPRVADRVFRGDRGPARVAARVVAIMAAVAAFLIHPLARRQEADALDFVRAIYAHTQAEVPVITNTRATLKYLSPSYGPRKLIPSYGLHGDSVAALARRFGPLDVVLLDRTDSEMFRQEAPGNARLLADVERRCTVRRVDEIARGGWARLQVFRLTTCG